MSTAKDTARQRLESLRDRLVDVSHRIHGHPELGYEEEKACAWLCEELADSAFEVEPGVCELPTAFRATAGKGPLHVVICAEYDALPGIGHACGHNIIAASSLGAALALAPLADDLGLKVTLLGTPAEEKGDAGGKIVLLERGAFGDAHFAMMAHPAPYDVAAPPVIAASMFEVHYHGKASHASAFPEQGINAADAMTIAQTAIGLLRQHILPTQRIHGIITHGGEAPNIIPSHTSARYIVRGKTIDELEELRPKVLRCFEAGAIATGARLEIVGGDRPYAQMRHDMPLAQAYQANAESVGRSFPDLGALLERAAGSTDMGNVSLALPSIHPMIGLGCMPIVNHQPEFTAFCATSTADRVMCEAAMALAATVVDAATVPALRDRLLAG
jgi:amidohydrolase